MHLMVHLLALNTLVFGVRSGRATKKAADKRPRVITIRVLKIRH